MVVTNITLAKCSVIFFFIIFYKYLPNNSGGCCQIGERFVIFFYLQQDK